MSPDACRGEPALPAVDDRLVAPETRYEILEGRVVHVAPADPPHGTRHSKVSALLEAHAGLEFTVASDMLTRTSERSDVAPDASVFPSAPDPRTGGRQLEQLAFEIVSTQSLAQAGRKAAQLAARGVRRVFAIDVERGRALEWSAALGSWTVLDPASQIADPALDAPLPVEALVGTARADDTVARALLVKHNPVLVTKLAEGRAEGKAEGKVEGLAEGKAEGRAEGKAEAVIMVLVARGFVLDDRTRARLLGERDARRLDRWIARATTCATVAELDADPGA
jgi:Putative restriction endonuclease